MIRGRRRFPIVLGLALAGCGGDPFHIGPIPVGDVRLDAAAFDVNGTPAGTLTNTDADGVRVWMLEGGARVDSSLTILGAYGFSTAKKGHTYRFMAGVPPAFTDTSRSFTPTLDIVFDVDTLLLAPRGGLTAAPNPFSIDTQIEFAVPADGPGELAIYSLAASRERTLESRTFTAGIYRAQWDGNDDAGHTLPKGSYWAVFSSAGGSGAALLVKQP